MKNPYVNIIGHPDDGRYDIDYEALVQGAKEYGKVLELNNHSMDPDCTRENAVENDTIMLNYCKKYQVPVVMDSDAHFDLLIGEFDLARALLTKLDFFYFSVSSISFKRKACTFCPPCQNVRFTYFFTASTERFSTRSSGKSSFVRRALARSLQAFMCHVSNRAADRRIQKPILM